MRSYLLAMTFASVLVSGLLDTPSRAQDLSIVGRICPADLATYAPVDGRQCDPDMRNSQACDRNYKAPSDAWNACYAEISACHDKVTETNSKIASYNSWVNQCQDADRKRQSGNQSLPTKPAPQGAPSDDLSERLKQAQQRNQQKLQENGGAQQQFKNRVDGAVQQNEEELAREQAAEAQRQAQREAQAREQRKWHCYGQSGDTQEGFHRCRAECEQYYNVGFCKNQCYSSGSESLSNGRSCFKEP